MGLKTSTVIKNDSVLGKAVNVRTEMVLAFRKIDAVKMELTIGAETVALIITTRKGSGVKNVGLKPNRKRAVTAVKQKPFHALLITQCVNMGVKATAEVVGMYINEK